MIDPAFVQMMARYNAWQNRSLIAAAEGLTDDERRRDRRAFFKSIHATFNHLLWADEIWLHRLIGAPKPAVGGRDSTVYVDDWSAFRQRRAACDDAIITWSERVEADWLCGSLTWHSAAAGREMSNPRDLAVMHLFNHQTHHRGQIHAMLTAAGCRPGDTDLIFIDEPR